MLVSTNPGATALEYLEYGFRTEKLRVVHHDFGIGVPVVEEISAYPVYDRRPAGEVPGRVVLGEGRGSQREDGESFDPFASVSHRVSA